MPRYDYMCPETGEIREVTHGMNETPEIISEAGHVMVKIPSLFGLSGFDNIGRSTTKSKKDGGTK